MAQLKKSKVMKGRKKLNVETLLYDLDAAYRRDVLGAPGDPKKQVPKLLAGLRDRKHDVTADIIDLIKDKLPTEYEEEKHKFNFEHPEFISFLFRLAAQLDKRDRAGDRAISDAFEMAGLDVRNPLHWRLLME